MVRKKIDNRLRILIENGVAEKHRSMFVVVGDHGRDQVVILHHMLSKATVRARPSVLWCYKKELGFSSHRKKRMKQLQKKIKSGKLDVKEDDPFELFVASTNIRYCYYAETHKILGQTFGMCILQDFEALTPNLLARTIETVEGGGVVVILLKTMASLKQLYTMSMDVHARYRTESHQDVVGRFNERFLLSLTSCKNCMVIDDQFNMLPVSSHILNIQPVPAKSMEDALSPQEQELRDLKDSLQDTQPVGSIVNCCKTLDQVGTPSPENLKTVFEFVFKGFDTLEYQEHLDYEIIQSTNPDFNKAIVRANIFREHRQTIQYIHPSDSHKLGQAELVCIDEAAAIPLPLVKNLLGPYLVFMSSTINGYEGTGRSLSLKLVQQLRQQSATFGGSSEVQKAISMATKSDSVSSATGRALHEIVLNDSIRYANGDPVEKWLNDLLCLDATNVSRITSGCPVPESCDLYYVNRDTLFSYHKASEGFLHRIMALYVSSHYKITFFFSPLILEYPNDLQLLSDAPAHHIFALLGPVDPNQSSLPEVLYMFRGDISSSTIMNSLSRGKRASGDLIPWTISQQFQDQDFAGLSGARVVRIATHPDYQSMGYGTRAMNLLQQYYKGEMISLSETKDIEDNVTPVDEQNDLTGEHSCIMLKMLHTEDNPEDRSEPWLAAFWKEKMSLAELEAHFTKYDVKRLELYAQNMVDYHLVIDLLPAISRLFFLGLIDTHLSVVQSGLLLGLGLQHRTVDELEKELDLPSSQLLGLFNRIIRKIAQNLNEILEADVEKDMVARKEITLEPVKQTMDEELNEAANEVLQKQRQEAAVLSGIDLTNYAIRGSEHDWQKPCQGQMRRKGLVSVKR
ncbi:KRE33 [Mytilus edulis]|uniref:RNA cytidine acetyltransferase n=1 Tax=Mytilus edulis TaxID=6550 RepID=A0A8S3UTX1_MYTED|nr:KRE33 [Mytilus edulis]